MVFKSVLQNDQCRVEIFSVRKFLSLFCDSVFQSTVIFDQKNFFNNRKIILIISCLKQRKCQYAYFNANIIRCLIWKNFRLKPNHLIFHLTWPDMTSYFMYLVICPVLYVNLMWIFHTNVPESGPFPSIGNSCPCFVCILYHSSTDDRRIVGIMRGHKLSSR